MDDMQRKQIALLDAVLEMLSVPVPEAGGVVASGSGAAVDSALRKLQEKDPEFPRYDGTSVNFVPWLVTVEKLKNARKLPDHVAIVYATGAFGSHARGIVRPDQTFAGCTDFIAEPRKKFCPLSWNLKIVWSLEQLRMHG